jgi:translin
MPMERTDERSGNDMLDMQPVIQALEVASRIRDQAIDESRQIIRLSANAIRALHRSDVPGAERLTSQARERLDALVSLTDREPTVYWAGYVQDAMKEHVESMVLSALLAKKPIPDATQLNVEIAPYLNGLAEAASELRRHILDRLRQGDTVASEDLFTKMEDIYEALLTIDFPDVMTGGLRRSTDQLRGVVERTRADLTLTTRQLQLERILRGQVDQPPLA